MTMLSVTLLILTASIAASYQLSSPKSNRRTPFTPLLMNSKSSAISPTKDTDFLTIRVATNEELPRCAGFLSSSMYAGDVPKGSFYSHSADFQDCFKEFKNYV